MSKFTNAKLHREHLGKHMLYLEICQALERDYCLKDMAGENKDESNTIFKIGLGTSKEYSVLQHNHSFPVIPSSIPFLFFLDALISLRHSLHRSPFFSTTVSACSTSHSHIFLHISLGFDFFVKLGFRFSYLRWLDLTSALWVELSRLLGFSKPFP